MEPFAKKGTICKKRAQYAVRTVGRGRNLQEEEGEGTICKKRAQYAVRTVGRGSHLQEEEGEGTIFKAKEPVTKKREPFAVES